MVASQIDSAWNALLHPLTLLIVFVGMLAEGNRLPFDLPEAEQELIGGYQTEYSSMKMALFYLGEYAHLITASAFLVALFLGGWELFPFSERLGLHWLNHSPTWAAMLLRFGIVLGKVAAIICVVMLVRWTLPRFRFDQLMNLAWRGLVPVSLALLAWTGLLVYAGRPVSIWAPIGELVIAVIAIVWAGLRRSAITGRQDSRARMMPDTADGNLNTRMMTRSS